MALTFEDRLAIHELISLHGHLADDRRSRDLHLLLTDDAVFDVQDFGLGTVTGSADIVRLWEDAPGDQPLGHHVTNVIVTELDDDEVVKTEPGWRVSYRKVIAR
jgi:hypothetical protein